MAPEQVLGMETLDSRVDIYATGCLAYWLLTGKLVFDDPSHMAVFYHHANTLPTPPSRRTEMPIPESLDRVVLACLEKDPARRPQTARDLAHRLAETVDPGAWSEEQAKRWWATHHPVRS
jgi:serine/threonine-protein kinase